MSENTALLSNSVTEPVVDSAPIPLSPPQSFPDYHLSSITERTTIARADGLGHGGDEAADEGYEDEEEDFVAVGHEDVADYTVYFRRPPIFPRSKLDELHPFVQLLSLSNVEDCVMVEQVFPERERCSREKIIYRLTKCPELSLGLLSLPLPTPGQAKPRPTLIAHILATRTPALKVNEASMGVPPDWRSKKSTLPDGTGSEPLGHQDQGSTIAIHSLAVLPEHQRKRIGTTLMKAYIQRIKDAAIADRIALLAHDDLVPFYTALGFENRGPSDCTYGGGGWYDMILEFSSE